ncbi:C40 family peptidase [Candidatus Saccharibacteria bacterium]|nr:C40 family peptidase [Candidatus Saccharibacteria bacterium]
MRRSLLMKIAAVVVAFILFITVGIVTIAQKVINGAEVVAGALSGNPADLMQVSTALLQWASGDPIGGLACPNPNAIPPGTLGTAPATDTLVQAIIEDTSGNSDITLAMLVGAELTSGSSPKLVRAGAYGVDQLYDPGSGANAGISIAQALNAAQATNYELPRYVNAAHNVDPTLWATNPGKAAEETAYNAATGIADFPASPTAAAIQKAYAKSVATMRANGLAVTFVTASTETTADQFAQHLFVGVPNTATGLAILALEPNVAGFFLPSSGSPGRVSSDLKSGIKSFQAAAQTPLLIATDQEYTSSVNSFGLATGKRASDLASMSADLARQEGARLGAGLAAAGVNMDFAPSVDLQVASNPVIGQYDRGISSSPTVISRAAAPFIAGLASQKVLAVVKHFPGHGRTTADSHTSLPVTPPQSQMATVDEVPFKTLAGTKNLSVMVGHLSVPGLTSGKPASESPAAYAYLRNVTGFSGLAITDELGGMVGAGTGPVGQRIADSLNAGADLALFNVSSSDEFAADFALAQSLTTKVDDSHVLAEKWQFGLIQALPKPAPTTSPSTTTTGVVGSLTSPTGAIPGGLDAKMVPEPLRSIMIAAAKAENVPPVAVATMYLTEQNGFTFEYKYYDSNHNPSAFSSLTTTSPEWHLATYGTTGEWPQQPGFTGPFQFGPAAWAAYAVPGHPDINNFTDEAYAEANYIGHDGARVGANMAALRAAAEQYNGQKDFGYGGGIRNPDPSRFQYVYQLYADQVVHLAQALGGGGSGPTPDPNCTTDTGSPGQGGVLGQLITAAGGDPAKVIAVAKTELGTNYSWGGGGVNGPSTGICGPNGAQNDCNIVGFDCSGLTRYVFGQIGMPNIGQVANDQWVNMANYRVYDEAHAQPGFLVFFTGADGGPGNPGHVGIYLGGDKMISAPQSGDVVKISTVSTWGGLIGFANPYAWKAQGGGK